ncbi:hypothetical protein SAMN05421678_1343 [Actinopolymorpha cephalotaxi]|uniref:Uncharacterized protein n=1 Tax=Actinopolymorpha cephalotaxi TaxID=504797 RepID=A0A1I3CFV2_9ACTN|nr:hypothetical protein [Actinopolymorpha cephalotaxi]SFH73454.1 hypothetical protein SAMN05421678_1343 [Actinopolymorpha cephalotaxi]
MIGKVKSLLTPFGDDDTWLDDRHGHRDIGTYGHGLI